MMSRHLTFLVSLAAVVLASASGAAAQSLDSKHPAALVAGENTGTVDSMVGPQFWQFRSRAAALRSSCDLRRWAVRERDGLDHSSGAPRRYRQDVRLGIGHVNGPRSGEVAGTFGKPGP